MGDTIGPNVDTGEAEVAADTGLDAPTYYAYLFEVMYDEDGPSVKYGMDVSGCVSAEYREAIKVATVANKAAERLGAGNAAVYKRRALGAIIERDKLEGPLARAGTMFLRARVTGESLYMFITVVPLTFAQIENLLRFYSRSGTLKDMLERFRVV